VKISLYSDLHAHPYNNGVVLEHGVNSRVLDAANVISQVYEFSLDNDVDYVVFGGDLFDRRKSIDVNTYNTIHEVVAAGASKVSSIMIPGNHDQANRSGTIHALERFNSADCAVISTPVWCALVDDVYLYAVPYYDDGEVIARHVEAGLKEKPDGARHILLIHYGIEGAKIGPSDYVLPCELSLSMLHLDEWDIVFSGHYHIGQQLGSKFHYIGSAMQHRWDDVNFEKSFVVYDSETNSISRVPTIAPKFLEIRGNYTDQDVENCYVRVIEDHEIPSDKKIYLEKELKDNGALLVEFRCESPNEDKNADERIEFSESAGEYQILDDYLSSELINTKSFDKDKLLDIGKKILSQAMDSV
jgi:DNA repair exonuclease SbcCD nuclease subunit